MSTEAKHTPGPWRAAGRPGGWDGVDSADGIQICRLEENNPDNAYLIARAPEMAEQIARLEDEKAELVGALQDYVDSDEIAKGFDSTGGIGGEVESRARALLAKHKKG